MITRQGTNTILSQENPGWNAMMNGRRDLNEQGRKDGEEGITDPGADQGQ